MRAKAAYAQSKLSDSQKSGDGKSKFFPILVGRPSSTVCLYLDSVWCDASSKCPARHAAEMQTNEECERMDGGQNDQGKDQEWRANVCVVIPDWENGSNLDDYFKQVEADT